MKLSSRVGLLAMFFVSNMFASELANANSSSYSFNQLSQKLCTITQLDRVAKLRALLLRYKSDIRDIYSDVSCNGASLIEVALNNQALRMERFLKLKAELPSKHKQLMYAFVD